MVRRLTIALQVIPRHPAELGDRLRCTGLQRARNRRLLGTARPPKGPLDGWIEANGDITLRNRLGPTQDPQQAIEQFVDGTIADRLLWHLDLFPQRGKETLPFAILAQGTEAGTARGHRVIFWHKRTPYVARGGSP